MATHKVVKHDEWLATRRKHLNHRDITMAGVSRAPYAKLAAYKKRMGWGFPWLSSLGSDFNLDYRVSFTDEAGKGDYNYRLRPWGLTEAPGISVFLKVRHGRNGRNGHGPRPDRV